MHRIMRKQDSQARVNLLLSQPLSGTCCSIEPVERKGMAMPTVATDGDHLFYDPDFVMSTGEQ